MLATLLLPRDGSRCETREICLVKQRKQHEIGLLKKIDKDRFLSISLILSIIDKNFKFSSVIDFYQFFKKKKKKFMKKWEKNFGGTWPFFRRNGNLTLKMNIKIR